MSNVESVIAETLQIPSKRRQEVLNDKLRGKTVSLGSYSIPTSEEAKLKRKKKILSDKLHNATCRPAPVLDDAACADLTFDVALRMHKLWRAYMQQLITDCGGARLGPALAAGASVCALVELHANLEFLLHADLHGAPAVVARSRRAALAGLRGIIVAETARTFKLVAPSGTLHTLLKHESDICVLIAEPFPMRLHIHGPTVAFPPHIRGTRKFKEKPNFDL
eukprot:gnl/Chilomastix_cuspidata/1505.p4 GENE.gnl/Chilomastix_cuspidata/1505~~gnl/Chilomastix_cuspidata/1505.p4  ORF type:complete len:222 (+),score=98.25 gnl/Chilomastix_cuspidata/1505:940-1605(+)